MGLEGLGLSFRHQLKKVLDLMRFIAHFSDSICHSGLCPLVVYDVPPFRSGLSLVEILHENWSNHEVGQYFPVLCIFSISPVD